MAAKVEDDQAPGGHDHTAEGVRLLLAQFGGEGEVSHGIDRVGVQKRDSSEALRRVAPSGKYHCEEVLEAQGWLAEPWRVLTTWLTLAIPP